MQDDWRRALAARRREIRTRWIELLRARRPTSPLANPDTLVFMMDWTLDEILGRLRELPARRGAPPGRRDSRCACGLHPLLDYFATALEATSAVLDGLGRSSGGESAEAEACRREIATSIGRVRDREIEAFCAVCQHRRAAQLAPEPWIRSR